MTEREFCEIVRAVCKHPKMHTPNGTLGEVLSFLDGFGIAALSGRKSHSSLTPFQRWWSIKFASAQKPMPFQEFLDQFETEVEAIEQLPALYEEFVASGGQKKW